MRPHPRLADRPASAAPRTSSHPPIRERESVPRAPGRRSAVPWPAPFHPMFDVRRATRVAPGRCGGLPRRLIPSTRRSWHNARAGGTDRQGGAAARLERPAAECTMSRQPWCDGQLRLRTSCASTAVSLAGQAPGEHPSGIAGARGGCRGQPRWSCNQISRPRPIALAKADRLGSAASAIVLNQGPGPTDGIHIVRSRAGKPWPARPSRFLPPGLGFLAGSRRVFLSPLALRNPWRGRQGICAGSGGARRLEHGAARARQPTAAAPAEHPAGRKRTRRPSALGTSWNR